MAGLGGEGDGEGGAIRGNTYIPRLRRSLIVKVQVGGAGIFHPFDTVVKEIAHTDGALSEVLLHGLPQLLSGAVDIDGFILPCLGVPHILQIGGHQTAVGLNVVEA